MSVAAGGVLLEIAAEHLVPMLVTEVGGLALRHAARQVARSASSAPGRTRAQPEPTRSAPLRLPPRTTVLSQVPGRIRLQVSGLRGDASRAAGAAARLRALPGVRCASISPLTGSALVEYDPSSNALGRIRAALESDAPAGRRGRTRGSLVGVRRLAATAA